MSTKSGSERILVFYHGNCPDGFGGAYAAWKKFGDAAEYIPLKHGSEIPEVTGARAYVIDFCYPQEKMDAMREAASVVVVIDHHAGVRDVVERLPEHVFDTDHSGATLAWTYFHPEKSVPLLLQYVEDGDLYRFTLFESRALLSYLYTRPFEFNEWDRLAGQVEREEERKRMIERGKIYEEHKDVLLAQLIESADLVRFEGHECYFTPSIRMLTSDLGNRLAKKKPPLALMAHVRPDGVRISLRGDGSIDVAAIAQKYGGNGHPNAAAFNLSWGTPIPWEAIDETPE